MSDTLRDLSEAEAPEDLSVRAFVEFELPELLALKAKMDESDEEDDLDEVSDSELRMSLEDGLADRDGFMGVDAVFSGSQRAVYSVSTGNGMKRHRVSYETDKDGKFTFGEPEEVKVVRRFEPIRAAEAGDPADEHVHEEPTAASAGCGCGGAKPAPEGAVLMKTKQERIAALVAGGNTPFTEEQLNTLAANDAALDELESLAQKQADAKTAADKAKADAARAAAENPTEEDWLKAAPAAVREQWQQMKALTEKIATAEKAERDSILKALEAKKAPFTKEQLDKLDLTTLRDLAEFTGATKSQTPTVPVDFTGLGTRRPAAPETDSVPRALSMQEIVAGKTHPAN